MLEECIWRLLTISDVSAFSDSSTDGLWRSEADVYVFNGDELPENAFVEFGNRLVAESIWHNSHMRWRRIHATLTHVSAWTWFGKTGRTFSPSRRRSFIRCWRCPCQSTTRSILATARRIYRQMRIQTNFWYAVIENQTKPFSFRCSSHATIWIWFEDSLILKLRGKH